MEQGVDILQVLLSLVLVIGLIGLSALALKRLQRTQGWLQHLSQGQDLKMVERMMLDAKTRLNVVQWKQKQYLILVHASGAQVLDVEKGAEDVA